VAYRIAGSLRLEGSDRSARLLLVQKAARVEAQSERCGKCVRFPRIVQEGWEVLMKYKSITSQIMT